MFVHPLVSQNIQILSRVLVTSFVSMALQLKGFAVQVFSFLALNFDVFDVKNLIVILKQICALRSMTPITLFSLQIKKIVKNISFVMTDSRMRWTVDHDFIGILCIIGAFMLKTQPAYLHLFFLIFEKLIVQLKVWTILFSFHIPSIVDFISFAL